MQQLWAFVGPLLVLLIVRTGIILAATSGSAAPVSADVENEARLLVQKTLMNKYVVESMDIVLKYSIYNVGGVTATNVHLTDLSMGPDFQLVGDSPEINLGRIAPGGNATHTIVARPLKFGYFNFTSAIVTYSSGENTQEVLQVYSSEPGEGYVAPFREFDKRFSPHFLDWAAFAIMSVPPLLIPFLLWHSSKAKYETVLGSKKSK